MAWVQSHPQGSSENLKAGLAGGRVQTRESRKLGRGERGSGGGNANCTLEACHLASSCKSSPISLVMFSSMEIYFLLWSDRGQP